MGKKIDWEKVWEDFETWITNPAKPKTCASCGNTKPRYKDKEWEEQQAKIQKLVNAQIRKIARSDACSKGRGFP